MNMRSLIALGLSLALSALPVRAERATKLEPATPSPDGQRRSALVIGNSAYKVGPLRNPVNDARAMGRALADTGFQVQVLEDATQAGMRRAIREFGKQIASGGIGLFYYAGHGMQVRGKNYLIPVNADIQAEDEIVDQAIDANFVLAKMDSANNGLNIVILDACRNNPFHRSFRSAAQGLAQMDAPSGTLIAFATAPGSVAADGDGDNGLYTKHLLDQIRSPGVQIEQLFKQVRVGVTRDTRDRQVPWESSSLRGD
ncbi:MAG: caspase family protein, partial [Burkholderiales bacterium]|nr:caspase family protein [Burkholderiales bacterium]